MTDGNSDGLEQIRALLSETVQITRSNAKAIEANSTAIAANSAAIAVTREASETTRASVDGLVQTITEFSIRTEARLNKLDEAITDIKTTNQNLERILEQLTRHERNGNGDQPQP